MMRGDMKHGRHVFNAETVGRALAHHEREGRITFLSPPGPGQPKFRIRLAASYDFDVLEYSVREAYMLNLGLTTMERLARVVEPEEATPETLGDALDILLGGPEHFTSDHCTRGWHQVCMRIYGGRSCECECHADTRR